MNARGAHESALPGEGAFLRGTALATMSAAGQPGSVAVESLKPGDTLLTLAGSEEEARPVRALHLLEIDAATHPSPLLVTPICISAGALAAGVPASDLLLPPEAMLRFRNTGPADGPIGEGEDPGHLVPAAALLNGTSITRVHGAGPQAWFIPELGEHAILLAAGAAMGSARPPLANGARAPACIPICMPGAALNAWRRRLSARAENAGMAAQPAPPPRFGRLPLPTVVAGEPREQRQPPAPAPDEALPLDVVAAGASVPLSSRLSPFEFAYELPARTGPVRLRSQPRHAPGANEGRRFGVCILEIRLDGSLIGFDAPAFGPGFHPLEANDESSWRWTNGDAWLVLPYNAHPRRLQIRTTSWHQALAPI